MDRSGASAQKRGPQVDVELSVPIGGPQVVERLAHVHGRHVDEDIEAAQTFYDRVDELRARIGLRQVGLNGHAAPSRGSNAVDDLFGLGAGSRVAHGYVGASRRQRRGNHGPDALAAGNKG